MFSQVCVKDSVHRGVYLSMHWGRHPPWAYIPLGRHPCADTPWADTPQADTPCPVHAGIHTHLLPSACWDTHTPDGHCSGRYASYWNAFLFHEKGSLRTNIILATGSFHRPVLTCQYNKVTRFL